MVNRFRVFFILATSRKTTTKTKMIKVFLVLCLVAVCLASVDEDLSETGRRYPSRNNKNKYYKDRNRNDGLGEQQPVDAAYYSSMDQQVHPEEDDQSRDQHFSDWNGPTSYSSQADESSHDYYQTSYTQRPTSNNYYYNPQSKQEYGGGASSYTYTYEGKGKGGNKGQHKGGSDHGDLLWDLIGKKSKLEKAFWDFVASCIPDWVWKSKFGHSSSSSPQKGYGYPSGGDHDAEKGLSKEDIFHKVKLLAITATALLGTLGGGILAAPLLIGKGRRSLANFLPDQVKMDELTQLADRVLQAIQSHTNK